MEKEKKPVYLFKKGMVLEDVLKTFLLNEIRFLLNISLFVTQDKDIEDLHDFRVVNRRSRGVLKLFRRYTDKEKSAEVLKLLKEIFEATGHIRDYDIFLKYIFEYKQKLPQMEENLHILQRYISEKRDQEFLRLKSFLESDLFKHKITRLLDVVNGEGFFLKKDLFFSEAIKNILKKNMKKLDDLFGTDLKDANDFHIHKIRIELKKIRYLFDIFKSFFKKKYYRKILEALKNVQDLLGKNQDLVFQLNFVKNYEKATSKSLKDLFEFIIKQKQENMAEFISRYEELKDILPKNKHRRLLK